MYNNTELDRRLKSVSNDANETSYLFQRISVALQRSNCFCTTLFQTTHQTSSHPQLFYILLAFSPLVLYTLGYKNKSNKFAQSNLGRGPRGGAVAHVRRKVPIGYNCSVVCRLSVCWCTLLKEFNFSAIFLHPVYLGYPRTSVQHFTEIVPEEPIRRGR